MKPQNQLNKHSLAFNSTLDSRVHIFTWDPRYQRSRIDKIIHQIMPNKSKDNNIISHNLIHMSNYQDDDGSRSLIIFKLKKIIIIFLCFLLYTQKAVGRWKGRGNTNRRSGAALISTLNPVLPNKRASFPRAFSFHLPGTCVETKQDSNNLLLFFFINYICEHQHIQALHTR